MTQIKTYTPIRGMLICVNGTGDYVLKSEVEEIHNKELQELRDKAIKLLTKNCDCTAKLFDDNNCEECYVVHSFTQKLNEQ